MLKCCEFTVPLIYCCLSFGVKGRDSSLLTFRAVRRLPPYPPRLRCLTTFLRRLIALVFFAFKLKMNIDAQKITALAHSKQGSICFEGW